jgi:hypothetical protein
VSGGDPFAGDATIDVVVVVVVVVKVEVEVDVAGAVIAVRG